MNSLPSKAQLTKLKSFKTTPNCLSIYAPYIDPNNQSNPNLIEFKNLFKQAKKDLKLVKVDKASIDKMLRPANLILDSHEFWPAKHTGLVFFIQAEFFAYYHVQDRTMPQLIILKKGFELRSLEKIINQNVSYFLLALNHKNVQLYKGDRYQLKPVKLKNFPINMKSALNIDEYPKWRQKHEIAPSYLGKGSEGDHGQYNIHETDKIMLVNFFRIIDQRLHRYLQRNRKPLIVAGVGYLIPIYRKVNTSPYLIPGNIKGNLEYTDLKKIEKLAWPLIKNYHQTLLG